MRNYIVLHWEGKEVDITARSELHLQKFATSNFIDAVKKIDKFERDLVISNIVKEAT